jgi:hypothetical protein
MACRYNIYILAETQDFPQTHALGFVVKGYLILFWFFFYFYFFNLILNVKFLFNFIIQY